MALCYYAKILVLYIIRHIMIIGNGLQSFYAVPAMFLRNFTFLYIFIRFNTNIEQMFTSSKQFDIARNAIK
jgi:hypothetical protein